MKHAHYDNVTGEILGYYDDTIHADIPLPNIQLTDAEWQDCISNSGRRCIDVISVALMTCTQLPASPTDVAAAKIAALSTACEAAIVSGFTSTALGTSHTYQSDRDDQLNLIGAVSAAADIPFKCADETGAWDYRLHTAAQIRQVLSDGAAVKLSHLQTFGTKKAQVDAIVADATLTDDEKRTAINAVVW